MNQQEKLDFINRRIVDFKTPYDGPTILSKYRKFDDFTYSMLRDKTLYLCPAGKLDDETECVTDLAIEQYYDFKTNQVKKYLLEVLFEIIKPFCKPEAIYEVRRLLRTATRPDGGFNPQMLLEVFEELSAGLNDKIDHSLFINMLVEFSNRLGEEELSNHMVFMIKTAFNARYNLGVCSLTTNDSIDYMWENYADNNSGYCIEYDLAAFPLEEVEIFPVIYCDKREFSIPKAIVECFVTTMMNMLSNHQLNLDTSQYVRLFLSKFEKWSYQDEWRMLGPANTSFKAPTIKRVIIGKNATKENKNTMIEFCNNHNIKWEIQK